MPQRVSSADQAPREALAEGLVPRLAGIADVAVLVLAGSELPQELTDDPAPARLDLGRAPGVDADRQGPGSCA